MRLTSYTALRVPSANIPTCQCRNVLLTLTATLSTPSLRAVALLALQPAVGLITCWNHGKDLLHFRVPEPL